MKDTGIDMNLTMSIEILVSNGMMLAGLSPSEKLVEIIEIKIILGL